MSVWCLGAWVKCFVFFVFKQNTAYEMRISDWSSDVCSSDLDFRPIIAVGGLLERIDFAADLGRRLAECGQEAIQIADSIPADVLRDTIMRVRRKRRDLEKERIAITREPEVDELDRKSTRLNSSN